MTSRAALNHFHAWIRLFSGIMILWSEALVTVC